MRKKNTPLTPAPPPAKGIKVQLDMRTTVTLASLKSVEFWRQRYPNLKIIG